MQKKGKKNSVANTQDSVTGDVPVKPKYAKGRPIPLERCVELVKKGLSHSEIAKILGCTRECVSRRVQGLELGSLKDYQENEHTILAFHRRRILNSITDNDLKRAGLSQKVIGAGVLLDKERLISGKSTANINASVEMTVEHKAIAEEVIRQIKIKELDKVLNELSSEDTNTYVE